MGAEFYDVYIGDKLIFSNVSEPEYFRIMEDLSLEFYQTGAPNPDDIKTKPHKGTVNG